MTLAEFKAWFEGFTEDMDGAPNEKQFECIKAKVKDIDGVAITKTVFVDHYYAPYRRYFDGVPIWNGHMTAVSSAIDNAVNTAKSVNAEFSSHCAMIDLGKAEYKAVLNG